MIDPRSDEAHEKVRKMMAEFLAEMEKNMPRSKGHALAILRGETWTDLDEQVHQMLGGDATL